jgi:hypothetical protein
MKEQIVTHLIAAIIGGAIAFFVLEYRDRTEPIPIDPKTYKLQERIRIEREVIKPLQDSLTNSIKAIEELKARKQKTRTIYIERQNENLNLSDSASFNLLLQRISAVLPND